MRNTAIRVFGSGLLILSAILVLVGCGGSTPTAPVDPLTHLEAGRAHQQAGDIDKAIAEFEAAIQADSTLTEAHFRLGNAYAERGQLDKAAEEFKAVVDLDAKHADAHSNLGVVYYQKGLLTEATSEFQAALDIKPGDAEVHYLLGAAYVQMGRLDEAVKEFNTALEHDPELPEAYFGLGTVYQLQGNKEEAIKAFERFLEIGPAQDPQAKVEAERQLSELGVGNVTYWVGGTAKSAFVTYETSTGTEQRTVSLPWSKSYKFNRGDFVYISAQNQGDTGTIRVEIRVGGQLWKHAESSGPYVIASADGILY